MSRKSTTKGTAKSEKVQQRKNPSIRHNLQQKQTQTYSLKKITNLELKNNDKIKEILDTRKVNKCQRQPNILQRILTSATFGENTTQWVTKRKNKKI